jgi:aminopeptidase N
VAASRADLDLLAGLLNGSADIDGLAVDTELRWLLLHRLVAMGVAGEDQIDTELDNDRTDAGERHAIAARAAIPTPEAKARAWAEIVGGDLPNAMFRAALNGFQDMDQTELLAPFAEPFFEVLAGLWESWGSDQAQYFATGAYPVTAVSQQTLDRTDAYLETAAPPAPLRRLLSEDRDDIARQLRCRERDAQAG